MSARAGTRLRRPIWAACCVVGGLGSGALELAGQELPGRDDCLDCHLTLDEERLRAPAELFELDVHAEQGFDCLSCHGRVSDGHDGLDASMGFLARPERRQIPGLCGRCHSDAEFMRIYDPAQRVDQELEYRTSGHGRALMEDDDPDVATCVGCHPVHQIRATDDPESSVYALNVAEMCGSCHGDAELMAPHDVETHQLEDYRNSVHGRLMYEEEDASAPTCNDCHGNHGAAPPGLASVRNVCGECHAMMAEFFEASGHVEVFDDEGLPGCATCHEHHAIEETSDELLADRSETVCASCHAADDEVGGEFRVMKSLIDSLEHQRERSLALLHEAENSGMEVSQALFDLDEVGTALVKARTAIHAFQIEPVQTEIETGLETVENAFYRGELALWEHWFRRAGLAISAAIILVLILTLIMKIRHLEVRVGEMIGAVDEFFRETIVGSQTGEGAIAPDQLRLAACALLLELAHADDDFSETERDHLVRLIRRRFRLDAAQAERLIQLAATERAGADLGQFTSLIESHFTLGQKRSLLDAMWGLVLSDGDLAEHEFHVMEEITHRLGLETEWRTGVRSGPARRWMTLFFSAMGRKGTGAAASDFDDLQLAACALLVELVYADESFSPSERRHLRGVLQQQFGLSRERVDRLIQLTEDQRAAGIDIREMVAVISQHYSRDEKLALADAMWSLVLSDGVLAEKERSFVEQITALLEIEPEWLRRPHASPDRPEAGSTEGGT